MEDDTRQSEPESTQGVQVRTLVVSAMPMLVASLARGDAAYGLVDRLVAAGVEPIQAFVGHALPRGARVGFVSGTDLRLVDERDSALLRVPQSGVDPQWMDAARKMKGTMLVVLASVDLSLLHEPGELVELIDGYARQGGVLGAVVGFGEQRPSLPLMFG